MGLGSSPIRVTLGWRGGVCLPLCLEHVGNVFEVCLSPMASLCMELGALLEVVEVVVMYLSVV